jgi:FkbM family methyltransferase
LLTQSFRKLRSWCRIPTAALSETDIFASQKALFGNQTPDLILDIGANAGDTVVQYRSLFPHARIHAFEPFPDCADQLRKRFENDADVSIVEKAVADGVTIDTLYVSSGKTGHSLLPRPTGSGVKYFGAVTSVLREKRQVATTTVDAFCRDSNIDVIDILKIDVEGGERRVLSGAGETLATHRARMVCIEVMFAEHFAGQALFSEICNLLEPHGYSLFDLFDLRRSKKTGQLRWGNGLFLSSEFREHFEGH